MAFPRATRPDVAWSASKPLLRRSCAWVSIRCGRSIGRLNSQKCLSATRGGFRRHRRQSAIRSARTAISISGLSRRTMLDFLHNAASKARTGNADLVAHFFRRAFWLAAGRAAVSVLIATNTAGQGDKRAGLRAVIRTTGGSIMRAIRRLRMARRGGGGRVGRARFARWPHAKSGAGRAAGAADFGVSGGRRPGRQSGAAERPMQERRSKACILLGQGFIFDDEAAAKGKASSSGGDAPGDRTRTHATLSGYFPPLGGEEVNSDPRHAHRRWTIDFNDFPLRRQKMIKTCKPWTERERARCRTLGVALTDYPDPVAAGSAGLAGDRRTVGEVGTSDEER